jgi:hypothetical protein
MEENIPDILYHYTSAEGLSGILKDKMVWATVATYLNDSREYVHGVDIAKNLIKERLEFAKSDDLAMDFYQSLEHRLSDINNGNDGRQICVFSLSGNGDLLSQWRGYCPASGGYSIGFNVTALSSHLERQGFRLKRCEYEIERQRTLVGPLLTEGVQKFRGLAVTESRQQRLNQVIEGNFIKNFSRIASLLKDEAFMEENEWRAVSELISHRKLKYRIKNSMPIPHFPLTICEPGGPLPIRQIIIGPMANQFLAEDGVRVMLLDHDVVGGDFPRVLRSKIPFRPI